MYKTRATSWPLLCLLLGSPLMAAEDSTGLPHTFRYTPPAGVPAVPVEISGDFNGWSDSADAMVRGADGNYSITVPLVPGLHYYKLVCDGKEMADPAADKSLAVDNGFGDVLSGVNTSLQNTGGHVFHYVPPAGSTTGDVSVAGDFNGWSTTANPMVKGGDGSYSTTVPLTPGSHHYKFVCDGKWIPDPSADRALDSDDSNGGLNSGVNFDPHSPTVHTFHYAPPAGSPNIAVTVAGDFNGWSTTANPVPRGDDGSYSVALDLTPGTHYYKFVVDGKWMKDPSADPSLETDDGNGGKNSGFKIEPASANSSAATTSPAGSH